MKTPDPDNNSDMYQRHSAVNVRSIALVFVVGLFVYGVYIYNNLQTKLRHLEEKSVRFQQQYDSASAQLQVVYEHKTRLEKSLQDEKTSHKKTREDSEKRKVDIEQKFKFEKDEFQRRIESLDQEMKILKSHSDDLQAQHAQLLEQKNQAAEDSKRQLQSNMEEYQKLKLEKETEITKLRDALANLERHNAELLQKLAAASKNDDQTKEQLSLDTRVIKKLHKDITLLQNTIEAQKAHIQMLQNVQQKAQVVAQQQETIVKKAEETVETKNLEPPKLPQVVEGPNVPDTLVKQVDQKDDQIGQMGRVQGQAVGNNMQKLQTPFQAPAGKNNVPPNNNSNNQLLGPNGMREKEQEPQMQIEPAFGHKEENIVPNQQIGAPLQQQEVHELNGGDSDHNENQEIRAKRSVLKSDQDKEPRGEHPDNDALHQMGFGEIENKLHQIDQGGINQPNPLEEKQPDFKVLPAPKIEGKVEGIPRFMNILKPKDSEDNQLRGHLAPDRGAQEPGDEHYPDIDEKEAENANEGIGQIGIGQVEKPHALPANNDPNEQIPIPDNKELNADRDELEEELDDNENHGDEEVEDLRKNRL